MRILLTDEVDRLVREISAAIESCSSCMYLDLETKNQLTKLYELSRKTIDRSRSSEARRRQLRQLPSELSRLVQLLNTDKETLSSVPIVNQRLQSHLNALSSLSQELKNELNPDLINQVELPWYKAFAPDDAQILTLGGQRIRGYLFSLGDFKRPRLAVDSPPAFLRSFFLRLRGCRWKNIAPSWTVITGHSQPQFRVVLEHPGNYCINLGCHRVPHIDLTGSWTD